MGALRIVVLVAAIGIAVAFFFALPQTPREVISTISGSDQRSCTGIQSDWSVRNGRAAAVLLQEHALQAKLLQDWHTAACLLELAIDKAGEGVDQKLQPAMIRQLASVYRESGRLSDAEQVLSRGLEYIDPGGAVSRIRRLQILLDLADLAGEAGDLAAQEEYLGLARAEDAEIETGLLIRERLYLAEIAFFEELGAYDRAADSALRLLECREAWAEAMPNGSDDKRIEFAREEYARLLRQARNSTDPRYHGRSD